MAEYILLLPSSVVVTHLRAVGSYRVYPYAFRSSSRAGVLHVYSLPRGLYELRSPAHSRRGRENGVEFIAVKSLTHDTLEVRHWAQRDECLRSAAERREWREWMIDVPL